ncbi:sensor histidine kinase [Pedobacter metabolipauper]|uniref:histidine kinase n=1 Tax=Pedobacter metabolipauper TaxID=425513 RepID=A0A4R6T057_9SPHI|nr:sensor histidine kinase [Pedobacter metabolipauper]TDQ12116.1 two-component sensor histidine kinase [Pedobacter metabolipauper]
MIIRKISLLIGLLVLSCCIQAEVSASVFEEGMNRKLVGSHQQEDITQLVEQRGAACLLEAESCNTAVPAEIILGVAAAKKAVSCFERVGNKQKLADAYALLAELLNRQGRLSRAMTYINKSININRAINTEGVYACLLIKGQILFRQGAFEQALGCFQTPLSEEERKVSDLWKSWPLYNRAALACIGLENFYMAEIFFKQGLTIAESEKDQSAIMLLSTNMMALYILQRNGKKAREWINATELNHPLKRKSDLILVSARTLEADLLLKDMPSAEKHASNLAELSAYVDESERAEAYKSLIPFLLLKKRYELAEKYLIYNDYFYRVSGYGFDVAQNHRLWSALDSATKDQSGQASHHLKYLNIRDSLLRITQGREMAALGSTFDISSVPAAPYIIDVFPSVPAILPEEEGLNLASILRYASIGFLLLLIIFGGIRLYKIKKTAKHDLQKKQEEIVEKNNSLQHMVNQKDILLEEKEWLMKEIHHRVKNNLQIVISLLNTQSAYLDDNKASAAIRESQQRMQSISLIHQKLYQSNNMDMVDMKDYMTELIENLVSSFDLGKRILIEKDIEKIQLDVSRAVPIGLIINEAIINAIKYAFPDNREGAIRISFQNTAAQGYLLKIADDGNGLREGFDINKCKSLGMNLIKGLAKQVKGEVYIESNQGVSVSVNFGANP